MGCLSGIARLLLVVINMVFLLLGLGLTVVGFILRYGKSIYEPFLEVAMNQMKTVLKEANLKQFDMDSINLGDMLESLSIGLIIGGLVLVGIAFFGCCGACCKIDCMLWLYAIVIIVFIVGEAVAIGLLYGKPDLVKDQLKTSLKDFKGLESAEVQSFAWNLIMIQFKCCGVDSYEDFSVAANWKKNPISSITLATPVACCKTLPDGSTMTDFACANTPYDAALNNGDTGCYQTVWDITLGNNAIAIPVLVVCGIIQLLFIVFAIYIAKADKSDKVSPI